MELLSVIGTERSMQPRIGYLKIGNSEASFFGAKRKSRHFQTNQLTTKQFKKWSKSFDRIYVVSVVDKWTQTLKRLSGFVCMSSQDFKISLAYKKNLGVDRVAAVYGALQRSRRPVLVVDMGTAITLNFASHQSGFCGGWIVPGPQLLRTILYQGTSKLPNLSKTLSRYAKGPGKSTASAILNGEYNLIVGLCEQASREAEKIFGCKPDKVITGGYASRLRQYGDFSKYRWEPDLWLKGLRAYVDSKKRRAHRSASKVSRSRKS